MGVEELLCLKLNSKFPKLFPSNQLNICVVSLNSHNRKWTTSSRLPEYLEIQYNCVLCYLRMKCITDYYIVESRFLAKPSTFR